jgi:hypothetical protein
VALILLPVVMAVLPNVVATIGQTNRGRQGEGPGRRGGIFCYLQMNT